MFFAQAAFPRMASFPFLTTTLPMSMACKSLRAFSNSAGVGTTALSFVAGVERVIPANPSDLGEWRCAKRSTTRLNQNGHNMNLLEIHNVQVNMHTNVKM